VEFKYDNNKNLIEEIDLNGNTTIKYEYGKDNRLITAITPNYTTIYFYDNSGKIIREELWYSENDENNYIIETKWNKKGDIKTEKLNYYNLKQVTNFKTFYDKFSSEIRKIIRDCETNTNIHWIYDGNLLIKKLTYIDYILVE